MDTEGKKTANVADTSLFVSVRGPEKLLYEGDVSALSSVNERGPFDVLPMHENFISIIGQKLVLTLKNGEIKEFPVDKGVMRTYKNNVDVFLGIEALAPEEESG